MITLPINLYNSSEKNWRNLITTARDKREELASWAKSYYEQSGLVIRPIVLVQVERVGQDQRGHGLIHADDVFEYLTQRLGISSNAVAIKTSERDDIESKDLMADDCTSGMDYYKSSA